MAQIERLVKDAVKNKKNRVEYLKCFNITNLFEGGIVQTEDKSRYDRVTLEKDKNESIKLYGLNLEGSYFKLDLIISSLYATKKEELRWRLAKVDFVYYDAEKNCKYLYFKEKLLDYEEKRNLSHQHEVKNIYKIGSMSVETVLPFSLSRIFFNGLLSRKCETSGEESLVSAKINISTHPTCDKFDYRYRLNEEHLIARLKEENSDASSSEELLNLLLEDRIDQPMMFQGQFQALNEKGFDEGSKFIMWGAKMKTFIDARDAMKSTGANERNLREALYVWTEGGMQIHLIRPVKNPNLVYGMIHNTLDYGSQFYGIKVFTEEENKEIKFSDIDSLANLNSSFKISITGYKTKEYSLEIGDRVGDMYRATINGFQGFALYQSSNDLSIDLVRAQSLLWAVHIKDDKFSTQLASEKLLGGKGNSLLELNRYANEKLPALRGGKLKRISVPNGIVVSCTAYELWLQSNPLILSSINSLDGARKVLAAKTVYTNPMSDSYMSLQRAQQMIREECEKTNQVLRAQPLPATLKKHLYLMLSNLFKEEDLRDENKEGKLFAVRSSAVGEDSLETSAAGQMKTILDACGFESICNAVVECWASQFEVEAVTYKTQNGLPLNLPMAVVIQELIQCEVAGVATTCDALSGNRELLDITANRGLGEGVVAGKQTDSVKVNLRRLLKWKSNEEEPTGTINMDLVSEQPDCISKESQSSEGCCLSDDQIVALSNILLKLRAICDVKEREVEWGITSALVRKDSSSSSSSDDSSGGQFFQIHLLQSRPLTHLSRLSSSEISHELDSGFSSPLDIVSRANLGEVMPGAMSPSNVSFHMPLMASVVREKPYEPFHTQKVFAANSFGFYGQMATMILTYSDAVARFSGGEKGSEMDVLIKTMIGTGSESLSEVDEKIERLKKERLSPFSKLRMNRFVEILALDAGLLKILKWNSKRSERRINLTKDLDDLESLMKRIEAARDKPKESENIARKVESDIKLLFNRLCTDMTPLHLSWTNHMKATILSMVFNIMCMKLLSEQSAYPSGLSSPEVLHDFSILIRGGECTESGDISKLLDRLVLDLTKENSLEKAKEMSGKQLYEYLSSSDCESARLYRKFMDKNGHRAFKEFDLSTHSWADNPSYIIKSLAARLKQFNELEMERKNKLLEAKQTEQTAKIREIMAKIEKQKAILTGYALPRARNAVARREETKSQAIKINSIYRQGFRHLGGLLCLAGRLPSADLVFHMAIEELALFITESQDEQVNLGRILYKARRRQQRVRLLDRVTFAKPTLNFSKVVETICSVVDDETGSRSVQANNSSLPTSIEGSVRGMTSCSGCVTGRACVVNSLDEMDQVEQNDILITYSIDISWSVYFFALAGIVTELGGVVSHGAVVAREYGIPTLCTAVGACSKFKSGQIVTLDATKGICYLAEANAEHK